MRLSPVFLAALISATEAGVQSSTWEPRESVIEADSLAAHIQRGDSIKLYNTNIKGRLAVEGGEALGALHFERVGFYGISLRDFDFHEPVAFSDCSFRDLADFGESTFHDTLAFVIMDRMERLNLSGCTFKGPFEFRQSSLMEADFCRAKAYADAQVHSLKPVYTDPITLDFSHSKWNSLILENVELSDTSMATLAKCSTLTNLFFASDPKTLSSIRRYFRDNYFRQQEREVTCAIQRRNHESNWLYKVLFDVPFQYGASLDRPFAMVFLVLFPLCSGIYFVSFHGSTKKGLYVRKFPAGKSGQTVERIQPTKLGRDPSTFREYLLVAGYKLTLARSAMFFSLLSTFNVGFRDVDLSRWLRLILPVRTEYEAFGWVRTISGLQSILSVLLMAFGLIFYFGRFFD